MSTDRTAQPGVLTPRPSRWGRFRLIALDVDGTLAGPNGTVSARTVAALERVERTGLRVVIITGRAYPNALALWQQAHLSAPLLTCGGALTLQPPAMEVLDAKYVPGEAVRAALELGGRLGLTVGLLTKEKIWVTKPGPLADLLRRINVTAAAIVTVDTLPEDEAQRFTAGTAPVLKLMLGGEPALMDRLAPELLDTLPGVVAVRSMPEFVEATAPEASTAGALQALARNMDVAPDEVIAVGNSDNDLGMLRGVGLAVVPADATPAALAAADLVVGAHHFEGLAEFLEALARARGRRPGAISAQLRGLLGSGVVSARARDLSRHSYDAWPVAVKWRRQHKSPYRPEAVVRPRSREQISSLLRWAGRERVPVTPWGLGSSVTGAPLPTQGGVVLDMSGMSRVLLVDATDLLVRVEAGKVGLELEEELQARGFTLGHSPQSIDRSSVGGWVATRSTGQFSSRYGSIEDLVVALSVVLPTGELIETPMVPRAAMGPDLRHLFIGAEGTTGVVVDVTLKIFPLPDSRLLETVRFGSVGEGLEAMRLIARSGLRPFLLRLYDQVGAGAATAQEDFDGCAMFLGTEGSPSVCSAEHEVALQICRAQGGEPLGDGGVSAWMANRFDFSAVERILETDGGVAETIEIAQFWGRILETYTAMTSALAPMADRVLGHFSHVYQQGTSLYLVLLGRVEDDRSAERRLREIWEVAMTTALSQGAALSHHHGIGLARLAHLREGLGSAELAMSRVGEALDPYGIMNPGKLCHGGPGTEDEPAGNRRRDDGGAVHPGHQRGHQRNASGDR